METNDEKREGDYGMRERNLSEIQTKYDVVVFGAGDVPTSSIILDILKNAKHIVACDGALEDLLKLGVEPEAVIGDGDSIAPELKEKYAHIFHQIKEQDDNDLTKATKYALNHFDLDSKPSFCILAATGKREDHTLGNLFLLLHYYRKLGINPVMISDYGWFAVASGKTEFASFPRQQVSVFQFGCQRISSEGLKWAVYPFEEFWQGTLNEATGNSFTIDADGMYLIYRTHLPK